MRALFQDKVKCCSPLWRKESAGRSSPHASVLNNVEVLKTSAQLHPVPDNASLIAMPLQLTQTDAAEDGVTITRLGHVSRRARKPLAETHSSTYLDDTFLSRYSPARRDPG